MILGDVILSEYHLRILQRQVFIGFSAFSSEYGPQNDGRFHSSIWTGLLHNPSYADTYVWLGPVGTAYLSCETVDHHCTALITSTAVAKQKEADEAAAGTKARRDF